MDREQLRQLLDVEIRSWAAKPYEMLLAELQDVCAYEAGGSRSEFHQFEVQTLEITDEYLHVIVSIDDRSLRRGLTPLSHSFVVYRDGRVEM